MFLSISWTFSTKLLPMLGEQQRKPLEVKGFLLYQYLSSFMVEAAGVEPASEGQATEASPSAFPVLILVFGSSQGQDQPLTSLLNFPPVAETITGGSLY